MSGITRNGATRYRPALWREYWNTIASTQYESEETLSELVISQEAIDLAKKLRSCGKPEIMAPQAKTLWRYFCKSAYNTQLNVAFSTLSFSGEIMPSTRVALINKVNKVLGEYGKSSEVRCSLRNVERAAQCLFNTVRFANELNATKTYMFDAFKEFSHPYAAIDKRHNLYYRWVFESGVQEQSSREIDLGNMADDIETISLSSIPRVPVPPPLAQTIGIRSASEPEGVDLGVDFPDSASQASFHSSVPWTSFPAQGVLEGDVFPEPDRDYFDWASTEPDAIPGAFGGADIVDDPAEFKPYPMLFEMIQKIRDSATGVKDQLSNTHDLFNQTLGAIKDAASPGGIVQNGFVAAASALTVGVGSIDDRLKSFFDAMPKFDDMKDAGMKYLLPLIMIICGMNQSRHEFFKIGFYVSVTALASYWGPWLLEKAKSLWDTVRPQSNTGKKFPWLSDAITVLRPIIGIQQYWSNDDVVGSLESSFLYETEITSELSAIEYIMTKALEAWGALKRLVGWAAHDYDTFVSGYKDVDEFVKDCLPLIEADYCVPNPINVDMVNRLFNMAPTLRVKYAKNADVQRILNDFTTPLAKLHKEFSQISSRANGLRPEPVSLMLYGEPGLGKSTALAMIKPRLMSYILGGDKKAIESYECAPDRYVYRRRNEEHWEQCFPTTCLVEYPDFGAMKSNENSSVKHEAEHIQLISCEPYEPHMAFEQKGKLKIKPRFIVSSTNNKKVMGETINHLFAFARRQLFVELVWCGEGTRPVKGAPLNVNDWGFQLAKCDRSTQYTFKHDTSQKPWSFDKLTQVLCILDRMAYETFYRNQTFIKTDTFDGSDVSKWIGNLSLKPGMDAWDYVRVQSRYTDMLTEKPVVENPYNPFEGYRDGAYENLLIVDGKYLTEDTYKPDSPNGQAIRDFNTKCCPEALKIQYNGMTVMEERPEYKGVLGTAPGGLVWTGKFEINGESMRDFQRVFFKDFVSMGELLFNHGPEYKEQAEMLRTMLLADVYRRAGVQIVNAPLEQFKILLERNEILFWYCMANFSDVSAAKKLVSHTVGEKFRQTSKEFFDFLKRGIISSSYSAMEGMMICAGAIAGSLAFMKLASLVFKPSAARPIQRGRHQASAYLDLQKVTRAKKLDKRRSNIEARKVNLQSNEVFLTGAAIAARSQWQLVDSDGVVSNMLALGGRDFVFNNHTAKRLLDYMHTVPKDKWNTQFIRAVNGTKEFRIPAIELLDGYEIEACDTYWVTIPSLPECKDISAHWVGDGYVEGQIHEGGHRIALSSIIAQKGLQTNAARLIAGRTVENKFVSMLWSTEMNTSGGDCGSACFIATQGPNQGKICGILQSGEEGMGLAYFCAISRHTMLTMRAKLSGYEPKERSDGKKLVVGYSPTPHNFTSEISDMLVPSEHPAKEAVKASVNVADPQVYALARRKYCPGFKPKAENLLLLQECMDEQLRMFKESETVPLKSGFKSYHEAIVGNDGTAFKNFPLSTSPGAPYNAHKIPVKKRDLLGEFVNGTFVYGPRSQEMMQRVGENLECLLRGEVPIDTFTDIVKSETLLRSKVEKGKGRIVSSCTTARSLVARMIYGNFFEWLTANHLSNGISAGDNMLGKDADVIIRQHLAIASGEDVHFAGDLSANDARQVGDVLVMACQRWNSFLRANGCFDDIQYRIAETYAKSYYHQFHIRGAEIDMWDGSLSSGDPCTTSLNSFCNGSYCRYSVWKSMGFPPGDWHDQFNRNVKSNYLGDDNWHTVAPVWKHYVSEAVMADGYADFGHVYTNDAKDGLNSELRAITDITYLKRTPRFDPVLARWTMVLDLDTVLEIGLWTTMDGKGGVPNMDQALTNVDTMCRELCFHPDEVWDHWIPKYVKMYEEQGWKPKYMDRRSMLYFVTGERPIALA